MLFNSIDFLVFFPIVVSVFFIIPKKLRYIWLLIASYYFYMSWQPNRISKEQLFHSSFNEKC